ncbi:MAG: bifunctional 4-hydroxy-2-oxoglutarate aldolase/2-dehydro-3-deoxy-phosphogluconate aldolase [Treponema sp.]|nr:bifunctional 4-hydroxy-2-oxoglutarate aldolase/2-dehydro-3-deoxy-phosphogluconate aldolase [Treponema sp.]
MNPVTEKITAIGLIPVVVIDDAGQAVKAARALDAGGVPVMEITLRTPAGLDAIGKVAQECPDILLGGGTVLTLENCKAAIEQGASFIVSPGFDPRIVEYCLSRNIAVFPGCVTPTEITTALNAGLSELKFFPANVYGGVKAIQALSGPFQNVRFIPTGGVDLSNLSEYIIPQVAAVGGGWLCERKALLAGNYEAITETCRKSVECVRNQRRINR